MQTSHLPNVWRSRTGTSPNSSLDRVRRSTQTAEQALFLKRFHDLLEKRREHSGRLPLTDWRRRLIDKALYSTYQDCLALDVGDEAREILEAERNTPAA